MWQVATTPVPLLATTAVLGFPPRSGECGDPGSDMVWVAMGPPLAGSGRVGIDVISCQPGQDPDMRQRSERGRYPAAYDYAMVVPSLAATDGVLAVVPMV